MLYGIGTKDTPYVDEVIFNIFLPDEQPQPSVEIVPQDEYMYHAPIYIETQREMKFCCAYSEESKKIWHEVCAKYSDAIEDGKVMWFAIVESNGHTVFVGTRC